MTPRIARKYEFRVVFGLVEYGPVIQLWQDGTLTAHSFLCEAGEWYGWSLEAETADQHNDAVFQNTKQAIADAWRFTNRISDANIPTKN